MNGLFVTGTDTSIGKTVLSALLLAELRRRDINAAPMKPVQTGCTREGFRPEAFDLSGRATAQPPKPRIQSRGVPDLDYSLSMAEMQVDAETYQAMAPYRFDPACSPHLAAEMAGCEIDIAEMVIAARALTSDYDFVIAEGAGGVLVPLNQRETLLDLMQALKFPVLLAARPGLGTINHTLLSIRALRDEGLDITGIVFVAGTADEPGFIEDDNVTTIEHFGKVPVLGTSPYCAQLAEPNTKYDDLPIPVVAETEKIVNQLGV